MANIIVIIMIIVFLLVIVLTLLVAYTYSMSTINANIRAVSSIPLASYKFFIGDRIRRKGSTHDDVGCCIVDIKEGYYWCDTNVTIPHSHQELYELIKLKN